MYTGAKLNFVENPDTVPENVREIAPTVFTAVPRVWEKFYSAVTIAVREASPLQQAVYAGRSASATGWPSACVQGQPVPAWLKAKFMLARWLALDNVRKLMGIHRARFLRHRRGADLARPDSLVPGAGRADVRGLGHDRDARPVDLDAGLSHQAGVDRQGGTVQRGAHRCRHRRDPGARPQRVRGLPEPAAEDRRDDRRRRLAAHRRRRHGRRRRLLPHHRPHEGHHHHRRRQERDAERVRERAEVLALRHRRGGDRRQAAVPHRAGDDRLRRTSSTTRRSATSRSPTTRASRARPRCAR